jgi:metal-responsive CopG/Arc/MetJ family transcriptional regulator
MRLHITLADDLVEQLDTRVGRRRRSAFITQTLRQALEDDRRWEDIEAGLDALAAEDKHDWDADPAGWVSEQRHADPSRVG